MRIDVGASDYGTFKRQIVTRSMPHGFILEFTDGEGDGYGYPGFGPSFDDIRGYGFGRHYGNGGNFQGFGGGSGVGRR